MSNGHITSHTEAIERKRLISDIRYDVVLALEKTSNSFFGQATIVFQLPKTITEQDLEYVFLNFTNGGCTWICDEIVLNQGALVDSSAVFQGNRIKLAGLLGQIKETSEQVNGRFKVELQVQYQLPYSQSREGLNLYNDHGNGDKFVYSQLIFHCWAVFPCFD